MGFCFSKDFKLASAITIDSGGSADRRGPIAQIGAGVGFKLASILKLNARNSRIALVTGIGTILRLLWAEQSSRLKFSTIKTTINPDISVEDAIKTMARTGFRGNPRSQQKRIDRHDNIRR